MPENDKEGFGFLYPKKDRKGNQPNVTGNIVWHGETIELAGWTKTAKSGVKYVSLKAQEAGGSAEDAAADAATEGSDDDIPF